MPERTGVEQGPVRLSWSRLRVHDECPQKGQLLADRKKAKVADIRSFFGGNVCDLAQRRWLGMEEQELGWMARHIDEIFDESERTARETGDGIVKWRSPTDKGEVRDFCLQLVTRLEPILAEYCLPFGWTPAYRFDIPFEVHGIAVRLVGEIDLLVFDNRGRVAVWDLKATRNNEYWRKVVAQLVFYAIAVRASGAEQLGRWPAMAGLIQPMCDQRVLPVTITPAAIREMGARIERAASDILAGRLDPRPGDYCQWCEVSHACPAWTVRGGRGRVSIVA
jgi:hypothetical protein